MSAALRVAGARRDWNACRAVLSDALAVLSRAAGRRVALEVAARALDDHLGGAGGDAFAAGFLAELHAGRVPPLPEAEPPPGPGCGNFLLGLEDLREEMEAEVPRPTLLASSIANSVMTRSAASWGRRHPEEWRAWLGAPAEAPVLLGIPTDPECGEIERAEWAAVADALEREERGRGRRDPSTRQARREPRRARGRGGGSMQRH